MKLVQNHWKKGIEADNVEDLKEEYKVENLNEEYEVDDPKVGMEFISLTRFMDSTQGMLGKMVFQCSKGM